MQHIASRQSLAEATEQLLAVAQDMPDEWLASLGDELRQVADLLHREVSLRRTLSETTLPDDTRVGIIGRLLAGRIGEPTGRIIEFVVRRPWSTGRDLQDAVTQLARTAMFLRAERTGELDEVEDQLFRFGRIVDANPELSVILDDPAGDPEARASLVHALLADRANPLTVDLLEALARNPGTRSFSHGVRELIEQAARRQDKVVADVTAAAPLSEDQVTRLTTALGRLYGRGVAVHVEVDPALAGGIRVQVGDEVIDGSVAGRLDAVRRRLVS